MSSKYENARRFIRGADLIRVTTQAGREPAETVIEEHNRARKELDRDAVQERSDR